MAERGPGSDEARAEEARIRAARAAGDGAQAARLCVRALATAPRDAGLLSLAGELAMDRGDWSAAIAALRESLAIRPDAAPTAVLLSRALGSAGDQEGALAAASEALRLKPGDSAATFASAITLQQLGRHEESVERYRQFLDQSPAHVVALTNGAEALRRLRRFDEARSWLGEALAVRPDYAAAHNHVGLVELDLGRLQAAEAAFSSALRLAPTLIPALANRATARVQLKRESEATEDLTALARLCPDFPYVDGLRFHALARLADWRERRALRERITARLAGEPGAPIDLPHSCLSHTDLPAVQRHVAVSYTTREFPPRPREARRAPPGARLKVGYFSNDFGEHALSYLIAGVIESHDPACFEWHGFGWQREQPTPMRERIVAAFSRFHDITRRDDATVLALVDELGLDIAVDLTGLTGNHRTGLFAARLAPVQVNWLGYPGTMGAPYMDYLIADRRVLPDAERCHYTEQPVWLPVSFQPFDDRRVEPAGAPTRADLGLPAESFVLAAFNDTAKLTPEIYAAWLRLLKAVPQAVLWLYAPEGAPRKRLLALADTAGVSRRRIVFAGLVDYAAHRARLCAADLFVDTSPFSGGATASDALSAGLPIITIEGRSFASRMAASLLRGIGLDELVARDLADYEACCLALAADSARLTALKERLRAARRDHAFFRSERYCRDLERAYVLMTERSRAGLEPAPIDMAGTAISPAPE
jgi:protein O-GlcNAc transferase